MTAVYITIDTEYSPRLTLRLGAKAREEVDKAKAKAEEKVKEKVQEQIGDKLKGLFN